VATGKISEYFKIETLQPSVDFQKEEVSPIKIKIDISPVKKEPRAQ
jgi:hypothetical protein